jgi:hypothetical protein
MKNDTLSPHQVIDALLGVVGECFDGAQDKGAFLNPGEGGLLDLLGTFSAHQASTPAAGTSMATHALHLSFSLDVFTDWIEGVRDKEYDWNASWEKSAVSEGEWRELLERIAAQAEILKQAIERHAPNDPESAWGAAGAGPHPADPLGALQVKADVLSGRE